MIPHTITKKQIQLALLLFTTFAVSCSHPTLKTSVPDSAFDTVMRSDKGVFRGFSLGDRFDTVQAKELLKPIESDSGYLYYEAKLDTIGSFNITYSFDEYGLNEIQSDIYINNAANADGVFSKFKSYFDEHYGNSESRQGFTVWTVKSKKYGVVRIDLSDESSDFTAKKAPGKISLWIYPEKEYLYD